MKTTTILLVSFICAFALVPNLTLAHCDTMDGPVIIDAKKAIETKNPNYFLIWIQEKDEARVIEEFRKTLEERSKNPEWSEAIDTAFFENLVKIHREGEGAEYTGLKPAGSVTNPIIHLTDEAVGSGTSEKLEAFLSDAIQAEVANRFQEVMEKKNYPTEDVQAGREYIASYVTFFHYLEGLHEKMTSKENTHASHMEEALHEEWSVEDMHRGVSHTEPQHHEEETIEQEHSFDLESMQHATIEGENTHEFITLTLAGFLLGMLWTLGGVRIFRKKEKKGGK